MVKFRTSMMESKVNIIPLINVIFVILIFFLVLYRFSTFDVESKDDETETETQELIKGESRIYDTMETVLVEVSVDGTVFIDGKEISNSITDFRERIEAPKQTICILNINKDAPYYTFGKLMYNLKIVGVERISFLEKD